MPNLEAVVAAIAASRKYRGLCADTVRRLAAREFESDPQRSLKSTIKATKRRLHQIYGAFEEDASGNRDYDRAYESLASAYADGSIPVIEQACRQALALHTSTLERLPILDRFYAEILSITGHPRSILDLGCGLNPLALPWMGLPAEGRYIALDIDTERIRFVNRYLRLAGLEPLARCQDILTHPPEDAADVALLLKMSPSLERQEPGTTLRILEKVSAPTAVVSFAVKSLGGREKGMKDHYQQQFLSMVEGQGWRSEELIFETELVFLVRLGRQGGHASNRIHGSL